MNFKGRFNLRRVDFTRQIEGFAPSKWYALIRVTPFIQVIELMRKKALLAIAFASGLLNPQLPALAEDTKPESSESVVQQITESAQMSPEMRAYYLLLIANSSLTETPAEVEERYKFVISNKGNSTWPFRKRRAWEGILVSWANRFTSEAKSHNTANGKSGSHSIASANRALANAAIQNAITEVDKITEPFTKLNLYYIASRLCQKVGDADGIKKCNRVIEDALKSCEGSSPASEAQVKAAASILDAMAFAYVPIEGSDGDYVSERTQQQSSPLAEQYSDIDFKKAERLKLRAAAMADRLGAETHTRRKVHRDLVLWYMALGRTQQAEKEKEILFKLVGFKDDKVLYPQHEGCGMLVWWRQEQRGATFLCGMG